MDQQPEDMQGAFPGLPAQAASVPVVVREDINRTSDMASRSKHHTDDRTHCTDAHDIKSVAAPVPTEPAQGESRPQGAPARLATMILHLANYQ